LGPHISGLFACFPFAELLESIGAVVVEIRFVESISKVAAEIEIAVQILPYLAATGIGFEQGLAHAIVPF